MIHAEVARFHEVLRNAHSLDEIIQVHDDQWVTLIVIKDLDITLSISLGKIRGRCLLKPNVTCDFTFFHEENAEFVLNS